MPLSASPRLESRTLRTQVYEYLRRALQRGDIQAGIPLKLDELAAELGVSRTPLREALIQLESEGFVEILPRRGCVVRELDLDEIQELYQLIGALESSVILEHGAELGPQDLQSMRELDAAMRAHLDEDDFDGFYEANLAFHGVFLRRSPNRRLHRWIEIWKQRLYDFPRRPHYVAEWERASCEEHARLVALLADCDFPGAAAQLREVHWSFEHQRPHLERYYQQADPSPQSAERLP